MRWSVLVLLCCWQGYGYSQSLLNGDFEFNTTGGVNRTNLSHVLFNGYMAACYSFGTQPNLDIITTAEFDGGPQSGNWMVALTGGGTDKLAMRLSTPLVAGRSYRLSFYDKTASGFTFAHPIEIGLSNDSTQAGTLLHVTSAPAVAGSWTRREFGFIAPHGGEFITVIHQGSFANWVQIDNFNLTPCPDSIDLGPDTLLCTGETLLLDATVPGGTYTWNDNSTNPALTVSRAGTYWVRVEQGFCIYADTVVVTTDSLPSPELGDRITGCAGETVLLHAGIGPAVYRWSDHSTDSILPVSQSGTYWVEITRGHCVVRDTVDVLFHPLPAVDLGADTTLCTGNRLDLDVFVSGATYRWQDGSTAATFRIAAPGTYWVTVTRDSCSTTDSLEVAYADCDCRAFMPTAFSPNGDRLNDLLLPQFRCPVSDYRLLLYNRWGELVFRSGDPLQAWDGSHRGGAAAPGYYTWLLEYRDPAGKTHTEHGQVRLIR